MMWLTNAMRFAAAHGLEAGPLNGNSQLTELDDSLKTFFGFTVPRDCDLYEALLLAKKFNEWRRSHVSIPHPSRSGSLLKLASNTEYAYAFVRKTGCDPKYAPFFEYLLQQVVSGAA